MTSMDSDYQLVRAPVLWVLAGLVSVAVAAQIMVGRALFGSASPSWALVVLGLASALPMAVMDRWPWPAFALTAISACVYGFLGVSASLMWVGPIVGVYVIAGTFGRRQGAASAVLAALALGAPGVVGLTAVGTVVNMARMLALSGAAMAFGDASRERRARTVEAELRAEQAELARASEAALIVDEERLRIARELHDVTAHSLSVIAVQSELARKTMQTQPDKAQQAIEAIGEVSRQSLGELRMMLGQLREGSDRSRIAASLSSVGDLIDALKLAGCTVESDVTSVENLPPFVDATAFRIVQEATTNIIRHAPGSRVKLHVGVFGGEVQIEIENTIPGEHQSVRGGHGLPGMRERALALGGSLEAGAAVGIWRVSARLPLEAGAEGAKR